MVERDSVLFDLDASVQLRRPTAFEIGGTLGSVAFGALSLALDTSYVIAKKFQPVVQSGSTAVRDFFRSPSVQTPVEFTPQGGVPR